MAIFPCSCTSLFQDIQYGRGMRIHNQMKQKEPGKQLYRCTVCLAIHNTARVEAKPERTKKEQQK